MTLKISSLAALALATPCLYASDLDQLLPENTFAYLRVADVPALREESGQNPFVEYFSHPEVQRFFSPLLEQMEADQDDPEKSLEGVTGLSFDEIVDLLGGDLIIGSAMDLSLFRQSANADDIPRGLLVAFEHDGKAETITAAYRKMSERGAEIAQQNYQKLVEQTMALRQQQAQRREALGEPSTEEDASLEDSFELPPPPPPSRIVEEAYGPANIMVEIVGEGEEATRETFLATTRNLAIFCNSEELLHKAIDRHSGESADRSFVQSSLYPRANQEGGDDLVVYLSLAPIWEIARISAKQQLDQAATNIGQPSGEAMMDLFQMEAIEAFRFSAEGTTAESMLYFEPNRGITKLLAFSNGDPQIPAFVPADVQSANIGLFNLSDMFAELEQLFASLSPVFFGMYNGYLTQVQQQSQVDLRAGILQNFGGTVVSYVDTQRPGETLGEPGQVFAIEVKDGDLLATSLKTLLSNTPLAQNMSESDYLGNTITAFANPQTGEASFSYAVTPNFVIFASGNDNVLKAALARIDNPGDSLAENEAIRNVRANAGGSLAGIGYSDFGSVMNTLFETLAAIQDKVPADSSQAQFVDPLAVPAEVDFPYDAVSFTRLQEDGLYSKSILVPHGE